MEVTMKVTILILMALFMMITIPAFATEDDTTPDTPPRSGSDNTDNPGDSGRGGTDSGCGPSDSGYGSGSGMDNPGDSGRSGSDIDDPSYGGSGGYGI
jgi:hypothetical protein